MILRKRPILTLLLPIIIWLTYGQFATKIKGTFDFKLFVHDFNNTGTLPNLAYDFYYILGISVFGFLFWCSNKAIFSSIDIRFRRSVSALLIGDIAWEIIDFIIWNNNYDYNGLSYQHLILGASGLFSYFKYYRGWTVKGIFKNLLNLFHHVKRA